MVRGYYTASMGMIAQRKEMNVIVNNSVNAETVGYKTDRVISRSFKDLLTERINDPSVINYNTSVGPLNTGVHIDQLVTVFDQGPMDGTDQNTDLALAGEGFFAVQTPDGERYTRAGNFRVNEQGYLTTQDGYMVLGNNGPIQPGTDDFVVSGTGGISVGGNQIDQLRLVTFDDLNGLRKEGDNLFYNHSAGAMRDADQVTVKQGYLEGSNAYAGDMMVDMMRIYRVYESSQRMLTMIDETIGKAVNDLGR